MEQIKILNAQEDINVLIFIAMCEIMDDSVDITEKFNIVPDGLNSVVNVQVLVNGVEIPFNEVFKSSINKYLQNIENHIKEEAKNMILNSNLCDLHHRLQNAEYEIEKALENIGV